MARIAYNILGSFREKQYSRTDAESICPAVFV